MTWKLGVAVAGAGFVLCLVMRFATDGAARTPWDIGALGFGGVIAVSATGLWISRPRR